MNVGRGTSLKYVPPLVKSSDFLRRVGWEVLGYQWCDIASCKLQKYCTVRGRTFLRARKIYFPKCNKFFQNRYFSRKTIKNLLKNLVLKKITRKKQTFFKKI